MRSARHKAIALVTTLCVTALWVQGCSHQQPKPAETAKVATIPATKPKPRLPEPEPEPQYPSPADLEDDEDDEPVVDAAAVIKLSGDWVWLGDLTPTDTFKVDKPNRYKLSIKANGWFELQADCVKGEGLFEAHGNRIALAVVEKTGEGCEKSHKELFLSHLEASGSYRLVGDKLRLRMKREKLEMVFYRPR